MGSDRAPQGANNYNTTELILKSNEASRKGADAADSITFLSKLLAFLNDFRDGRSTQRVTGDEDDDLYNLRLDLKTEVVHQFKESVNYEWDSGMPRPIHGDGRGFEPFDDFCSLFKTEPDPRTQISEYFEKNMEFQGIPLLLLAALESDLVEHFSPYLNGKPWDGRGWTTTKLSKSFYDDSKTRPIWKRVDLVFLHILVDDVVDLSGLVNPDNPALLIRYIGGLYRLHPDHVPKDTV